MPGAATGGLGRIPALDGIRAIAVIAVLLFHAGVSWMPGGTLGVDAFFVLSGFLITALLVGEHDRGGRIRLGGFYLRRVRRLLPALVLVLLFVGIVWGLLLAKKTPSLRGDALYTMAYVANWHFALSGQGYFASFSAPSPLLHTWSLAVEEQFYLLWPLVVGLLMARGRSVARWAGGLAALAFAATFVEYLAGIWTDRLYYGTDTRAIPLLAGAAFGAWYVRRPAGFALGRRASVALGAFGLVAAAAVGWAFGGVSGQSTTLYRGGFLLLALAVVVIIASVALVPAGPLARVLSLGPLRYLGWISYGVYLWHWPLFLLLTHQRTGLAGAGLLAVRFAVTLAMSVLSYHLIELPVRERRLRLPHPRATAPVAVATLVGVLIAATPPPAATTIPIQATPPADTSLLPVAPVGTTRVLVVGDSVALALAEALARDEQPYDIRISDGGLLGCGIARGSPRKFRGVLSNDPSFCTTWPQLRAQQVAKARPQLVVALVGEWELMDRFKDGRWQHIGQPAYDAYLARELDLLIKVGSARGARVALLTTPCRAPDESPSGAPWPESVPERLDRFNVLLAAAAKRHAATTSVIDLKALICPGGKFVTTLDGVTIRSADGIHFPIASIPPVAKVLLPEFRRLVAVKSPKSAS